MDPDCYHQPQQENLENGQPCGAGLQPAWGRQVANLPHWAFREPLSPTLPVLVVAEEFDLVVIVVEAQEFQQLW
jgi:hypothetical protein